MFQYGKKFIWKLCFVEVVRYQQRTEGNKKKKVKALNMKSVTRSVMLLEHINSQFKIFILCLKLIRSVSLLIFSLI